MPDSHNGREKLRNINPTNFMSHITPWTTSNPASYPSPSKRDNIPYYRQPGSENLPHTPNSTRDRLAHDQIPPLLFGNYSIPTSKFSPISLSPRSTSAKDHLCSRNFISGLLNLRSKLHAWSFNVLTFWQTGWQTSLAKTLQYCAINV